jgi:hypothetical protein
LLTHRELPAADHQQRMQQLLYQALLLLAGLLHDLHLPAGDSHLLLLLLLLGPPAENQMQLHLQLLSPLLAQQLVTLLRLPLFSRLIHH